MLNKKEMNGGWTKMIFYAVIYLINLVLEELSCNIDLDLPEIWLPAVLISSFVSNVLQMAPHHRNSVENPPWSEVNFLVVLRELSVWKAF